MLSPERSHAHLSLVVARAFRTRWSTDLLAEWTHVIASDERFTAEMAVRWRRKVTLEALVDVSSATAKQAAEVVHDNDMAGIAALALAVSPYTVLTFRVRHSDRDALLSIRVFVRKPRP
ncbi:MAG: hypothetical protein V4813_13205 [Gemmatimonadota bacterium]